MNTNILFAGPALALTLAAAAADAAVIHLSFAGLNGTNGINEAVLNYYNGGTGSQGSGPGPNYGIVFSPNALACTPAPQPGACNTAGLPTGGNVLFFSIGGAATMDVAAGFTSGFSFYYSAPSNPGFINVWSGLDATGVLLTTLALPTTPDGSVIPGCFGTNFCPYVPIGVTFAGTAMSVDFGGSAGEIGFADITLGTNNPTVPEPATWAMMLVGFGALGMGLRRKAKLAFTA